MKGPNERYHDRVAARYDDIYAKDAYWDYYFDAGFQHFKRYLPRDLGKPVLDIGCGTGLYGLALLKSGFRVVFADLSQEMLDRARLKATAAFPSRHAEFVKCDLETCEGLPPGAFTLVVAQGDPLSFVDDPRRAARSVARVMADDGVAVFSVDSRFGGIEPFVARNDIEGLAEFLRTGRSEWLADRREERFPLHAFTPAELRELGASAGLETLSVIGKTLFDLRGGHPWLEDRAARKRLLDLEARYGGTELGLGRGHHLQVIYRKPGTSRAATPPPP